MHMRYSRSNAATIAACLRKKASNDDRLLRFRFRNHFGSAEFHCDSRREGEAAERPVRGEDSGFRQNKARLANDIESITMLSLLQARNTKLAAGTRVPEILVIGLRLHEPNAAVPTDIVELIAMQRKSGMLFVCVRDADFEGTTRRECAFAVRRALPARAGHTTTSKVFASDWQPAGEATLNATDPAVDSMDALWESLCSQVILDDPSPIDVNTRLARRMQIAQLTAQVDKLTRDHQRAKNPEQRNEIYAKLHKMKRQLEELQGQ